MTVNTSIKAYQSYPINPNYYQTMSSTSAPAGYTTSPLYELGSESVGENNTRWMYVKASGAIKQYDCVAITETFVASSISNTLAKKGYYVGFAQVAFADGEYGWVAMKGTGIQARVKGVVSRSSKVYCPASASGSAGVLRTSATARIKLAGIVTVTTSSGSSKTVEVQFNGGQFALAT